MPGLTTEEVAGHLRRLATLLEYKGESPFRYRAFVSGADALVAAGVLLDDLQAQEGGLEGIKGIGKSIAAEIRDFARDRNTKTLIELSEGVPSGLFDWLDISGLGVKKARLLAESLGIDTLADLEQCLKDGRAAQLPGMGAKSVEKLLAGLDQNRRHSGRHLASTAWQAVEAVIEHLRQVPGLQRLEPAGSLRRGRETVGDADLVASAVDPGQLMAAFVGMSGVVTILGQGQTKSSVVLSSGLQVDLRVVPDREFPAALAHFTGSKEHNVALRKRALSLGLRLNEYGLFQDEPVAESDAEGRRAGRVAQAKAGGAATVSEAQQEAARHGTPLEITDEESLHRALGLQPIPPELREDMGEVEAALDNRLPTLLTRADYRGVLHCHTTASDGANSLRDMALACRDQLGLLFYGTGDHSQTAAYAGGLKPESLLRQIAEVDDLNQEFQAHPSRPFRIFKGTESDILKDGSLDYEDSLLAQLDYVVASVHSGLQMEAEEATERLIRAIRNPYTTILGHPSGRLLLRREGYPFRVEEVLEAAAQSGTYLEINASPMRLDLDWRLARKALDMGVRFAINPDAHSIPGLSDIRYGIAVARKAWIPADRVLNCLEPDAVLEAMRDLRMKKLRMFGLG